MTERLNDHGQPIGFDVPGWSARKFPPRTPMTGRFCRLEPLDPARHTEDLFKANREDRAGRNWTYLAYGPFETIEAYRQWVEASAQGTDPQFHAIIDAGTGRAIGVASYLRIDLGNGVIETGHLNYSPLLQRKPAATEAMYLMMARVFDELGYRRYEWKCDSLNGPSRAAADRLGFQYEGIFRQATIYKGRNRDTAWFAMTDKDWPQVKAAYQRWLDPSNFDAAGQQRAPLAARPSAWKA